VKRLIRGEKGQTMIMALVLLAVGGLIIAPLLAYMSTGLISGEVYNRRTVELYAADAGVGDAVWKIRHQVDEVVELSCGSSNHTWTYSISAVNDKGVEVAITFVDDQLYRVLSTATGDGSGTEIEAYIAGASIYGNYSGITDHVITSQGEIELSPGVNVTPDEGEHAPVDNYNGDWPPAEELAGWYFEEVEDEDPYLLDEIDLAGVDMELPPLLWDGFDEMEITNSVNPLATLTLNGTVYITGDTIISPTKDLIIDLNGNTIFVAGNTTGQPALYIGGKCGISGPGAIIAVGDIKFEPNIESGVTDPVFVMSVEGETLLQPGVDFYGSVAGSVVVDIQPGGSINYPEEGYGVINFPGCTAGRFLYGIATWDIRHQ